VLVLCCHPDRSQRLRLACVPTSTSRPLRYAIQGSRRPVPAAASRSGSPAVRTPIAGAVLSLLARRPLATLLQYQDSRLQPEPPSIHPTSRPHSHSSPPHSHTLHSPRTTRTTSPPGRLHISNDCLHPPLHHQYPPPLSSLSRHTSHSPIIALTPTPHYNIQPHPRLTLTFSNHDCTSVLLDHFTFSTPAALSSLSCSKRPIPLCPLPSKASSTRVGFAYSRLQTTSSPPKDGPLSTNGKQANHCTISGLPSILPPPQHTGSLFIAFAL
jgi:hypothetical protein